MSGETPSAAFFLSKISSYLKDVKPAIKTRKRKFIEPPIKILEDLETVLKEESMEWVRKFFGAENNGLNILADYLHFRLNTLRTELMSHPNVKDEKNGPDKMPKARKLSDKKDPDTLSRLIKQDTDDDIYFALMCFRAIICNDELTDMFATHRRLVDSMALSLVHPDIRVKTLGLELLCYTCTAKGGHRSVISAFDYFKVTTNEEARFKTLVDTFINNAMDEDFSEVCIYLIHILVHEAPTYNYAVYLQHEFSLLGMDNLLDTLQRMNSDCVQAQVRSYVSKMIDVDKLMEESKCNDALVRKIVQLEAELMQAKEVIQRLEEEVKTSRRPKSVVCIDDD